MDIDRKGITVYASTPKGHFYAIMTLKQLINQFGKTIPCMNIYDKPIIRHRGQQFPLSQSTIEYKKRYMEYVIPKLAMWKVNAVYLYLETFFDFPSLPHIAGEGALTSKDVKELEDLCDSYNMKLIPQLNFLGHCGELLGTQKYHEKLIECPEGQDSRVYNDYNLCACNQEVDKIVDLLLNDIINCFKSDMINIGGDEVLTFGECEKCKAEVEEIGKLALYIKYFKRIKENANKRGKIVGIWGDMLNNYFDTVSEEEQEKVLDFFREGVIVYDWHYTGGSYDTLKRLKDLGIKTIACAVSRLCRFGSIEVPYAEKQIELFEDAIKVEAYGGLTTGWCNFAGLHEEHGHYFFAIGASYLWSGKVVDDFDEVYDLQRYGFKDGIMTKFLRMYQQEGGEVTEPINKICTLNIRKSLLQSDNVFKFWQFYSRFLKGEGVRNYQKAIENSRKIWGKVEEQNKNNDAYVTMQIIPLIMHEHLLKRYTKIESMYYYYDKAANVQYEDDVKFKEYLDKATQSILDHIEDFADLEKYLIETNETCGLELTTLDRLIRTKEKIQELGEFLQYLKEGKRILPAFSEIIVVFMEQNVNNWCINRRHEWYNAPRKFKRYSIIREEWE